MGWGWIRIGIFTTAFLVGWLVIGPSRTTAGAGAAQLNSAKTTTIIILRDHSPQMRWDVIRKVRERTFD